MAQARRRGCYAFGKAVILFKNGEPQGSQSFCQKNEGVPEVVEGGARVHRRDGLCKIFSANTVEGLAEPARTGVVL